MPRGSMSSGFGEPSGCHGSACTILWKLPTQNDVTKAFNVFYLFFVFFSSVYLFISICRHQRSISQFFVVQHPASLIKTHAINNTRSTKHKYISTFALLSMAVNSSPSIFYISFLLLYNNYYLLSLSPSTLWCIQLYNWLYYDLLLNVYTIINHDPPVSIQFHGVIIVWFLKPNCPYTRCANI